MSLRENSHDNFSELSYFSGVVLYEWTRMFSVAQVATWIRSKLFSPPPLFATAREKKSLETRKKGETNETSRGFAEAWNECTGLMHLYEV